MPWAMAPTSPVKGCCTRYDVRKAKSSAVLFWVRAFCSLLGAEIERVRCRLLRTLVNSIRVLLIIIVPLPSPPVISWVIYLCEGAEGWCESCDAHNSVSIFWTIVAFRKEYFSLIVQLFWRNFLYFSSTKAFFFSWVCWYCLLPSEVFYSVLPRGFQHLCISTLTCKLLANQMVSPGFGLGTLAYERILAGSLAGWLQCALGLLQVEQPGKGRQKSASLWNQSIYIKIWMVSSRCEKAFRSTGMKGSGGIWFQVALSACAFLKALLDLVLHEDSWNVDSC